MTTKPYYECHITCVGNKKKIEAAINAIGWSFSAIDKDIVLGDGVKYYATRHFNSRKSEENVKAALGLCRDELVRRGVNVIRSKVELVLFDERAAPSRPSVGPSSGGKAVISPEEKQARAHALAAARLPAE